MVATLNMQQCPRGDGVAETLLLAVSACPVAAANSSRLLT